MTPLQLFESTSNDPTAWYRHLAGMTLLMQSRGPRRHRSPIARTVLEDIRYALVGRSSWILLECSREHADAEGTDAP